MATVCFPQNACHTSISDTNFLPTEKGTTYPGKYAGVFHEVATGTAPYLYLDEHNQVVGWLELRGLKYTCHVFSRPPNCQIEPPIKLPCYTVAVLQCEIYDTISNRYQ